MATRFVSERNIKFLLYEVFDVESLTKYEYYSEHNRKMFDMVLKAAVKLGKDLLFPSLREMDRNHPELVNGEVKVHPSVKTIMKEFGGGGWISSRVPFDQDGEQLPNLVADICEFIFAAANYSANVYPACNRRCLPPDLNPSAARSCMTAMFLKCGPGNGKALWH